MNTARDCSGGHQAMTSKLNIFWRWILLLIVTTNCADQAGLAAAAPETAERMLASVNDQRSAAGLTPLTLEPRLSRAAQAHADDMARHGRLDHEGSDGNGLATRLRRVCYAYRSAAENLAAGHGGPEVIVARWMNSPGHRRNLLRAELRHAGVGYARGADGDPYGAYWALALGTPLEPAPACDGDGAE